MNLFAHFILSHFLIGKSNRKTNLNQLLSSKYNCHIYVCFFILITISHKSEILNISSFFKWIFSFFTHLLPFLELHSLNSGGWMEFLITVKGRLSKYTCTCSAIICHYYFCVFEKKKKRTKIFRCIGFFKGKHAYVSCFQVYFSLSMFSTRNVITNHFRLWKVSLRLRKKALRNGAVNDVHRQFVRLHDCQLHFAGK